jgi:DNA-binding NarL/FixJ family response regulator
MTAELRPDVVLMDIRMSGTGGIEATRRIIAADGRTRLLVVSTFDLDEDAYDGLRVGAGGFLLKDARPEGLVSGIHAVATGDAVVSPRLTHRLLDPAPTWSVPPTGTPPPRTPVRRPSPTASGKSSSPSARAGPAPRSPKASS